MIINFLEEISLTYSEIIFVSLPLTIRNVHFFNDWVGDGTRGEGLSCRQALRAPNVVQRHVGEFMYCTLDMMCV